MSPYISSQIVRLMTGVVPHARCELVYNSPYQLLVAVVLSAQCTDVRVNKVTSVLFARAPTPERMIDLGVGVIEGIVRSAGFYKVKARAVYDLSRRLVEHYGGVVPDQRAELVTLPGVGRKTANVVLSECFGQPTIAVDTHVYRVSRRLMLSSSNTPDKVEQDLYDVLPQQIHHLAHQTILHFGRYHCTARSPKCHGCVLKEYCTYEQRH